MYNHHQFHLPARLQVAIYRVLYWMSYIPGLEESVCGTSLSLPTLSSEEVDCKHDEWQPGEAVVKWLPDWPLILFIKT